MKNKLTLTKIEKFDAFDVHWINGKHIGKMILDVDGTYRFKIEKLIQGLWGSYQLQLISDTLDSLNDEFDDKLNKDETKNTK